MLKIYEMYLTMRYWGFIVWTCLIVLYIIIRIIRYIVLFVTDANIPESRNTLEIIYEDVDDDLEWNQGDIEGLDFFTSSILIYTLGMLLILILPITVIALLIIGIMFGLRFLIRWHKTTKDLKTKYKVIKDLKKEYP